MVNKIFLKSIVLITVLAVVNFMSSCGTIVGGSKYYAHIKVNGKPNGKFITRVKIWGEGQSP